MNQFHFTGSQQTADDITAAAPELEPQLQSFPYAMENLAYAVKERCYKYHFLKLLITINMLC